MSVNDHENNSNNDSIHKNCSYCNEPFTEETWCKECDPFRIMEGWSSGDSVIDKFIKDTMCKPANYNKNYSYPFLEWVPFDKFTDIKEIGEGGFAKMYSAMWTDTNDNDKEIKVALKRLNRSQNMTDKYLNEVRFYYF